MPHEQTKPTRKKDMKKYMTMAAYALLMVFTTLSLAACGGDDDDNGGEGGEINGKTAEQIRGEWMITHSRATKNADWTKWAQGATIQFNEKGEYIVDLFKAIDKGTYTVSGNIVHVVYSDGTKQTIEILRADFRTVEVANYENGAKTPNVYYKASRVPTTADEAKQLFVGQWKLESDKYDYIYEYTADGIEYEIQYIPTDAKDGKWYSDYKGQYVGWARNIYILKPKEADPFSYGDIDYEGYSFGAYYKNLTGTSMEMGPINYTTDKYRYLDKKVNFTKVPN